jgi:hypothetical protein
MSAQSSTGGTFEPIQHKARVAYEDTAAIDNRRYRWQGGKLLRRSKSATLRSHRTGR